MATDNRIDLNLAQNTTGWTGDDSATVTTASGDFYQGGTALSTQLSDALEHMYTTSIGGTRNMSNASVWFLVKDNLQQGKAAGGGQVVIGDGTDRVGFYVNGNDAPGLSLPSYYNCLKLDVSNRGALSSNVYAGVLGNLTVTAITQVGYGTIHAAKANGAIDNVWMDASRFIVNTNYALTIDSGTVGTPITFSDVVAQDISNGWGMISNLQGNKIDINASWEWGAPVASVNADSYFEGAAFQVFIDARDMGAGNFIVRTRAGSGTNSLVLTDGLFLNLGTASVWDLSDPDMNTLAFTRLTFTDIGAMTCPANAVGKDFVSIAFNNCGQMAPNGMDCVDLSFNGASNANGAMLLDTAGDSDNVLGASFTSDGTGHAIEITAAGTYEFNDFTFSGYGADGTANAVIRNSSGGSVTINVTGGDTPTFTNVGGGSSTTIVASVPVTITVQDSAGDPIQDAKVFLETTPGGVDVFSYGITNASGQVSTSFSGVTPASVVGFVRKGTSSPVYKPANINDTISASGLAATVSLVLDE